MLATNKVYIAVSNGTTLVWEEHTNLFNGYKTGAYWDWRNSSGV